MKKLVVLLVVIALLGIDEAFSQTGTTFWFAPPEVTYDHNSPGGVPIYLMLTCMDQDADVTISMPANPSFTPIIVNMTANSSSRVNLTAFVEDLETKPTNTVLNTGLLVEATNTVSVYYEESNTNNCDIFALKGANGLGKEFYIPLQNYSGFYNHTFATNKAYASFDIVATEDNTTILIYTRHNVDGHVALTPFTITLNRGQTYSCAWTGTNYTDPATHPTGAAVVSDKPIAITIKDDSCHNPSGGCYDLMGDQIVPVDIVSTEYIAVKGSLNEPNGDESVFITGIQNNTQVYIDGGGVPVTTLFAGQTFRIDVDNPTLYIEASKPVYCTHVTGFGCEEGMAVLPPLNCAGSEQVSFVRSTSEGFFLTLLVKSGAEDDFIITGPGTATINPASFSIVPGTNGEWVAARIQFNTTEIPVDQSHIITNSTDVFALGIINGGGTTGCRYGYFSEFVAQINAEAGPNKTVCANDTVHLNGVITGGSTTGIWTTNGTGSFVPDPTQLDADYLPSQTDVTGSVKFWLASTGMCSPAIDSMIVTFTPAPLVIAGNDSTIGANNPTVNLNGTITVATAWYWTGEGTFSPNNLAIDPDYTPSAAEISAGSFSLTLTTSEQGICNAESDIVSFNVDPGPTASAGSDQYVCENNASNILLSGSVVNATGGTWSGGNGVFNPGPNALTVFYTPTQAEIQADSVTLTLSTTGHGANNPATDQMTIYFSNAPTVYAGADTSVCANNADIDLNGVVSVATGGSWSGGLGGTFSPGATSLVTTYVPNINDINYGIVTLTLTSTGNGNCLAVSDDITIVFTPAPVVNAGNDISVCSNNSDADLSGQISGGASAGIWQNGNGTFTPGSSDLNAVYSPTQAEIDSGSVTLTLITTDHGKCLAVQDNVKISFTPSPVVSAGADKTICENNADVLLNGSVTIASGGTWSNGSGIFNPGQNALNAIYSPTQNEINQGSVTLILTSTGNGNCNAVSDSMNINISPKPQVNAGADQVLCENDADADISATVVNAGGGQWSGGFGSFTPGPTSLTVNYTPSSNEISNGFSTLILTSTSNGLCLAETDTLKIFYTSSPVVEAGLNQTVGGNNPDVQLNGSVSVASGGLWSGGSGTYNPNPQTLNAIYTPSSAEISSGDVTLFLTSTGNGNCIPVTDSMKIFIDPAPFVDAGSNLSACVNNATVNLNGIVLNAEGGVWSGGAGSFLPGNTTLNATYIPAQSEVDNASVTLTLTSTGNGTNLPASDQLTVFFNPEPIANAGIDKSVCSNNATFTLNGSVSLATGGIWSNGTGIFGSGVTSLNTTYSPTQNEITAGYIDLILTTTGNGSCNAVSDTVHIDFTPSPTVNAGANQVLCANNSEVTLNGTVTLASGGQWLNGLGIFNPGATSLSSSYTPHASEVSAGSVTLTLQSTGNGSCNAVTDDVVITFSPAPIVNAGLDITACVNNNTVSLNGAVNGAAGGVWSNGNGVYNPDNSTLNASYTPTAGEVSVQQVMLYLTSTGNGTCNPVKDSVMITYTNAPVVSAGFDQSVCGNNALVSLNGTIAGATGGQWSGGSGAYSPLSTTLNANYSPSASEISSGGVTLTLTSTGNGTCLPVSDQIYIEITQAPTVDAGENKTVCANNAAVSLQAIINGIPTGGTWSGGAGVFTPSNLVLNPSYMPSASEINNGLAKLFFTSSGSGNCNEVFDSVLITITPEPIVNAGADVSVCKNNPSVQLNGIIQNATGGQWTGGSGVFNPDNLTLNAVYTPTPGEIQSGTLTLQLRSLGNGNCLEETDDIVISFTDSPVVNAGSDRVVCENNSVISLNGSVTNAAGGQWSGVLGSFNPGSNSLVTNYTPTMGEISSGNIQIILTSTGNGNCIAANDTLSVVFTSAPEAFAGNDAQSCANNTAINLDGFVSIATGGIWSGGNGTYSPANSSLQCTYTPTPAEIASGGLTITLTTTGNGNCLPVSDNLYLTINPSPVVNAGSDQVLCSNNASTTLTGSVLNASGGIWSGGAGVFNPGASSLSTQYTPTLSEISNGSVTLTLSSTGNGTCNPVSDNITLSFSSSPSANAGVDQTLCKNNPEATLNGTVTQATGGTWSGGLGTYTPNNNSLNVTYYPTANELAAGFVNHTLATIGNGDCLPAYDQVRINYTNAPTVDAGVDKSVCANNINLDLSGFVSVATGGAWTSTGTGVFSPSVNDLNASYIPSASDISSGTVKLILTSTGNGNCIAASDSVNITIVPAPIVNAGSDQTVCPDNLNITLNGSVSGGTTSGLWSSSGTGYFNPGPYALSSTYIASSQDSLNHTIQLYLTSTNNGNCLAVMDSMTVNIFPAGVADAGADMVLCSNNGNVQLAGNVSGGATGGQWISSGSGSFSPSSTNLNATYIPSVYDTTYGSVVLTLAANSCNYASDQINIVYTTAPYVNAGSDISVCVNNPSAQLSGLVSNATGGIWSGGTGTFVPDVNALNATYVPSSGEMSLGFVKLVLTSTGNGDCIPVRDTVIITITPPPVVNAGANKTVCANNANVQLNGQVTGGSTTGKWSTTGTGTFSPDANTLNAIYVSSQDDIAAGTIVLTLASTNNGGCTAVTDNIILTYTAAPEVNAGNDISVCANNIFVQLSGTVTVSSGGIWSTTGTGEFYPTATSMNPTYIPSDADTTAGSVIIKLTSTGNGSCNAVSDELQLTMTQAPYVNAGQDIITCVDNLLVPLYGQVSGNSTTGIWASTGTGSFLPGPTSLTASYQASAADSTAGMVYLILTSTNNGTCNAETDTLFLGISPAGIVDAGLDQSVCANNGIVALNGMLSGGASQGKWTTSGSGYFVPDIYSLNASYYPGSLDTAIGNVTLTLHSMNSCNDASDNMVITYTNAPVSNAGTDQTVCANNANVSLSGSIAVAGGGSWSTSGTGIFVPNNSLLNCSYVPGIEDLNNGNVILSLTTTMNGGCLAVSDNMMLFIQPKPVIYTGPDQVVCEGSSMTQLMGLVSGSTNTGIWTTSGSGAFIPGNTVLNSYYEFSPSDIAAGSVELVLTSTNNGLCNAESSDLTITFGDSPFVFAGIDQNICADHLQANLTGVVSGGSTTGKWTTLGSGMFYPDNVSLNTTYYFSPSDSINGFARLILQSTNNGTCSTAFDTVVIWVERVPVVNAGPDQNVCEIDAINLSGSVQYGQGGIWSSSGTGTFVPNSQSLAATYMPGQLDIINGSVWLYLTSDGSTSCTERKDSVRITFIPQGIVDAGPDISVCKNNQEIQLNGSVSNGASTGIWSCSGDGVFIPYASDLSARYIPGDNDDLSQNLFFVLEATNSCGYASDTMVVTFTPSPTANAGPDQLVCANNPDVTLSGSVQVAGGGMWSTSGDGTILPNNSTLNVVYSPGPLDINNGNVFLYLNTTGNGNCTSVTDILELTISEAPVVNAGPDQEVCSLSDKTQLIGSVSGATSTGIWTTMGSGTFLPSSENLGSYYQFSPADIASGNVTLVLTSTNNGICIAESDQVNISFGDKAFVFAGEDQNICVEEMQAELNATITGGSTTGIWASSGTGTFIPGNETIDATYSLSSLDSLLGQVQLILTSTNNGGCNAGTDTILINVEKKPLVDAGADRVVCSDQDQVDLSALYLYADGVVWTSSGDGIIEPNQYSSEIVYSIGTGDKASGEVTLFATTVSNNQCDEDIDTVHISIVPEGYLYAGNDLIYCRNSDGAELSGMVAGGTTEGIWSTTGTGHFSPSQSDLNAAYIASEEDMTNDSVILVLTLYNSCNYDADSLVVYFTPAPVVQAGTDFEVCENNQAVSLSGNVINASGGIWSTEGDGAFTLGANNLNTLYNPGPGEVEAGKAQLFLTSVGNGTCNAVVDSILITISDAPVVFAGPDQSVCSLSDSTVLPGEITGGTSSGLWSVVSGFGNLSSNTDMNAVYYIDPGDLLAGSVVLNLVSTNNGNCLAESDEVVITFGDSAFVFAGQDMEICEGDIAQLHATISGGATQGQWYSPLGGTFIPDNQDLNAQYIPSASEIALGIAELTLFSVDAGTCNDNDDKVSITIRPGSVAEAGDDVYTCYITDTVVLSGSVTNSIGGYWASSGSGYFIQSIYTLDNAYVLSETDKLSGEVILTVNSIGSGSCPPSVDTMLISVIDVLQPDFNYSSLCVDKAVQFSDNSVILYGNITDYSWNFGGGNISHLQNPQYTYNSSGLKDVTLEVTSDLGCSYLITKQVDIGSQPLANFSWISSCYSDDVPFTDNSTNLYGDIESWYWTFGDSDSSLTQNPVYGFTAEGNYYVTLEVTTDYGCTNSITKQVPVYENPVASFEYSFDCKSFDAAFTDNSISQTISPDFWQWNFGDGSSSALQNPVHHYDQSGEYEIQLITGYSSNCVDTVSLNISASTIDPEFSSDVACLGLKTHFSDSSVYANGTLSEWLWSFGDNTTSSLMNPEHSYTSEGTFDVSLTVTSIDGCQESIVHQVDVHPVPDAGFEITSRDFLVGFTIEFEDNSSGATLWKWDFGDESDGDVVQSPSYIYNFGGTFVVKQVVENQFGCQDSSFKSIIILEDVIYAPQVPNGFTPNNDGENDVFLVRGGPFEELDMKIFNQWGERIFRTQDVDAGWDGTKDGIEQPVGVYVYIITAKIKVGEELREFHRTGDVTLLR